MLIPENELRDFVELIQNGALAEEYENFEGMRPAFVSIVGSWNYNVADENSDVDFKVTYWPTFEQFYNHDFPKNAVVTEALDFTSAPIHHFKEHMLKGNINFLEVAYTAKPEYIWLGDGENKVVMETFMGLMRELIPMNAIKLIQACSGTAMQKLNRRFKYSEGTEFLKEKFGYNTKEMTHAIRQLLFIKEFVLTGKINLNTMDGIEIVKDVRKGKFSLSEAEELFHDIDSEVSLLVRVADTRTWTDRVQHLDQFESDSWFEKTDELDKLLKSVIRSNMCSK